MKIRKITLTSDGRSNFHNVSDLEIRISEKNIKNGKAYLTKSQVKRIDKHWCGISGCLCGSSPNYVEEYDYNKFFIQLEPKREEVQPEDAYDIPNYVGEKRR